ncbi:hypothetical protein GCM10010343_48180 [Streptomyces avidinii]|nr:hypothetical protein GCM10010343_48180 [Streptomyces avidinii]
MKGLAQIGAPTSIRSSTASPTAEPTAHTAITAANSVSGRCQVRNADMGPPKERIVALTAI